MEFLPWLKLPMFFTTSFARYAVRRLLELQAEFDVVHVHSNMTLLQKEHYKLIKLPIVSTMHGTWVGERSQITLRDLTFSLQSVNDLAILVLSPFFDKYEDYALRYSNAVLIGSRSEWEAIQRRGVKNIYGRMYRVPLGVDTCIFHPKRYSEEIRRKYGVQADDALLLYVGRLAARKGVKILLEVFREVLQSEARRRCRRHRHRKKVKLMIIGTGPQERSLKRYCSILKLSDATVFVGKTSFEELAALYASADLFVFHSLYEGFGLIIMEAMASGTPCVSTRVGAVPELISQGEDGYIIEIGDRKGMAQAILKLLHDDALRAEMGSRGRKKMVSRYNWKYVAQRTEKIYSEVVEAAGHRQTRRGNG
jgi:glycosyltransferase involved in cell wall biosynthesis